MSQQSTGHESTENLYQPLDESAYRIIHLLPGKFTDDIKCVLEIRQGAVMTSYEAISYEWGDPDITKPISVAPMGSQMTSRWPLLAKATEALEQRLKAMQRYLMPRLPNWIDLLCTAAVFVRYDSTEFSNLEEFWDWSWFILDILQTNGTITVFGARFVWLLCYLLSLLVEMTERKCLIFLVDLVFSPAFPTQPVQFRTIRVTTNLESALRYLRKESQTRTLWIDALCINQNNEDEKKAQIKLMDQIYSRAASTTVWLGGYHGYEEPECCGRLQPGRCDTRRQIEEAFAFIRPQSMWQLIFKWHSPRGSSLSKQGIKQLAKRGWWERLWVIQEVSLSTGRVYVQCGHNLCDYKDFHRSWCLAFQLYPELRDTVMASMKMMITIEEFCYSPADDHLQSRLWKDVDTTSAPLLTPSFYELRFAERLHRILLQTSGRFKCRDTRDRLHAVLGIAGGVTVGPRSNTAFFMKWLWDVLPIVILYFVTHYGPFSSNESETPTLFGFIVNVAVVGWLTLYYNSTASCWTICRPEYIIAGLKEIPYVMQGHENDKAGFFTALAVYLATETHRLTFLDALSCNDEQEESIPSWVPDWSKEVDLNVSVYQDTLDWKISMLDSYIFGVSFEITDAGRTLQVKGLCREIANVMYRESGDKVITQDENYRNGLGHLEAGKANIGEKLLSVPGCYYSMVLRQGKLKDQWRIVGLVYIVGKKENWCQLTKDNRLQVFTIV